MMISSDFPQGPKTGLFATGVYGIVKMVTCACFLLFAADSLGRRRSLLWYVFEKLIGPLSNSVLKQQTFLDR